MQQKISLFNLDMVIIFGSVWGLSEAALGIGLRQCASLASGSIMTGAALFFIAAVWARTQHLLAPLLLIVMASLFKMFDALLLGLPVSHGAVANPIFAFMMEGMAFLLMAHFVKEKLAKGRIGQGFLGGLAALLAVNLFPCVKFITGIPACVFPGTNFPLSLYYAPLAVGLSFLTVPLGFWTGEKVKALEAKISVPARGSFLRHFIAPAAVIFCLAIMAIVRLG